MDIRVGGIYVFYVRNCFYICCICEDLMFWNENFVVFFDVFGVIFDEICINYKVLWRLCNIK